MVCGPAAKLEVLKLAVPFVFSVSWSMLVDPSRKITMPVGCATNVLPRLALTVAVNITDCPDADGLSERITVVLVLALLTV